MRNLVDVLDNEVGSGDCGHVSSELLNQSLLGGVVFSLPGSSSLHLMERRVMSSVNGVSTVNVGSDEETGRLGVLETVDLMGTSVSSKKGVVVDIVGVSLGSSRMVLGESELVKVLVFADDWMKVVVGSVAHTLESLLNDRSDDSNRMGVLKVQVSTNQRRDGRCDVGPFVNSMLLAVHQSRLVSNSAPKRGQQTS